MYNTQYLCKCRTCGQNTSKKYAREHNGQCKVCVTGVPRPEKPGPSKRKYPDPERDMVDYLAEIQGRNDLSPDF